MMAENRPGGIASSRSVVFETERVLADRGLAYVENHRSKFGARGRGPSQLGMTAFRKEMLAP